MEQVDKGLHWRRREKDHESDGSSARARVGSTGVLLVSATRVVLGLLVVGWIWTIATAGSRTGAVRAPGTAGRIAAAMTSTDAPTAAFLTDASLSALSGELRGASGKLRAEIKPAGAPLATDSASPSAGLHVAESEASGSDIAPKAGIWKLAVSVGNALKPIADFSLISMRPLADKQNGKVGLYLLGTWPGETGPVAAPKKAPPSRYQPPSGFIEVTQANQDTRISDHFKLRDFLTHDQANVWPKYLVIEMRNVDKLELVLSDLAAHGIDVSGVHVMSGFRTPQYNKGGGDPTGRAGLSRHMYGDAADIFIDSDGNGAMDDLDHNGRVDINDARVILQAVDRVEAAHPELVGGAGVYPAESGHGPFIHIDSRGYHARWIGSGGGS
jgi:uncharacterized protein YcbK (DUF882 family)